MMTAECFEVKNSVIYRHRCHPPKIMNPKSETPINPFWSVSVKVITENFEGTEKIKDHFNFKTSERCKLSDLREQVKKEVLDKDDYLPVCTQCLVTARVMM